MQLELYGGPYDGKTVVRLYSEAERGFPISDTIDGQLLVAHYAPKTKAGYQELSDRGLPLMIYVPPQD